MSEDLDNIIMVMNDAFFSGNWNEAQRLSNILIKFIPDNPILIFMLANIEYQIGNMEEAEKHLLDLLLHQPDHNQGRCLLGLVYYNQRKYEKAIEYLHTLTQNDGALLALGNCYIMIGAHAAATLQLEKVGAEHDVRKNLAKAYIGANLLEQGEAILIDLINHPSDQSQSTIQFAVMDLGLLLIQQKRWDDIQYIMTPLTTAPEAIIVAAAKSILAASCLERDDLDGAACCLPPAAQTNWGHEFVAISVTQFRRLLRNNKLGNIKRREHPYPDSGIGVSCLTLGHGSGRFAHQLGDYLGLRRYADKYGIPVETPDWVGHYLFELDDPLPSGKRIDIHRSGQWLQREIADKGVQALTGYDFYSTGDLSGTWTAEHAVKAREIFRIRDIWKPLLEPLIQTLRLKGDTIVSIHIRLTDRMNQGIPLTRYTEWLEQLWPTLNKPVLYLASDDIETACSFFSEYKPMTLSDIGTPLPGLEWVQDFFILMNSDVVACSTGGFASFACLLNTTGSLFVRQNEEQQCLIEYSPLTDGR